MMNEPAAETGRTMEALRAQARGGAREWLRTNERLKHIPGQSSDNAAPLPLFTVLPRRVLLRDLHSYTRTPIRYRGVYPPCFGPLARHSD